MNVKVWNAELPPFPREGLCHLDSTADCPVTMLLKHEASKLARINQFDVPQTAADLRRFRKNLRARIWEKTGVAYPGKIALDVKEYGTVKYENYSVRKLTYQSRPGIHVTALLYIPDGEGPFPGVVHMHGHFHTGKLGERIQQTSMSLVKHGYVVLAVDAFGVYERATICQQPEYHGGFFGGALFNIGETLIGEQIVDNMRAVDLLESLPFVIKDKIGATGASGGGNQTMWLAALDERIAAAMPVVSVGSFESYVNGVNCVCEVLPDGMTFTEEAGILALIAPRPLNIGNALWDVNHTFSVAEMLKTYHQVEEMYWHLNAADNLRYTVSNRVHGMHDEQREALLGWFDCHLKGIGNGNPVREYENTLAPNEELSVFDDPADRPDEVRSTERHCKIEGAALRQKMLDTPEFKISAARSDLAKILRFRPLPVQSNLKRYPAKDGIERMALDVGDHLIPILMKPGTVKDKFTILLDTDGKNDISDAEIAAAGSDGATVVMFDLFGTGETARSIHTLGKYHQIFRQLLWVGRSVPGEWAFDILAVIRMLKRSFRAASVNVKAFRETGSCALFALALGKADFTLEVVNAPASYLFRRDSIVTFKLDPFKDRTIPGCLYTPVLSLPGFLKWGDVSLAAALCGDKVKFTSPRAYDGTPYTDAEIADFNAEVKLMAAKLR